jgi:hypothetical protein
MHDLANSTTVRLPGKVFAGTGVDATTSDQV